MDMSLSTSNLPQSIHTVAFGGGTDTGMQGRSRHASCCVSRLLHKRALITWSCRDGWMAPDRFPALISLDPRLPERFCPRSKATPWSVRILHPSSAASELVCGGPMWNRTAELDRDRSTDGSVWLCNGSSFSSTPTPSTPSWALRLLSASSCSWCKRTSRILDRVAAAYRRAQQAHVAMRAHNVIMMVSNVEEDLPGGVGGGGGGATSIVIEGRRRGGEVEMTVSTGNPRSVEMRGGGSSSSASSARAEGAEVETSPRSKTTT